VKNHIKWIVSLAVDVRARNKTLKAHNPIALKLIIATKLAAEQPAAGVETIAPGDACGCPT
jgi:hypothetical protein